MAEHDAARAAGGAGGVEDGGERGGGWGLGTGELGSSAAAVRSWRIRRAGGSAVGSGRSCANFSSSDLFDTNASLAPESRICSAIWGPESVTWIGTWTAAIRCSARSVMIHS